MKKENHVLKKIELIFALLKILYRIPSMFKHVLYLLKLKDDDYLSWGKLIEICANKYSNNYALKWEDLKITYFELNQTINGYSNYFLAKGIKKGDVINLFIDNRPELLYIYCALAKIGAISSFINPGIKEDGLLHCINMHMSDIIIVGEETWGSFINIRDSVSQEVYYISREKKLDNGLSDLRDLVSKNKDQNAARDDIMLGDPVAYVFTSGTTGGLPKAAIITHKRLFGSMNWFGKLVQKTKPSDTVYCPLPFYHTNGLVVGWPTAFANGAALAFRRKFSASNFLSDIRKFNASIFIYIGELPRYLMNLPEKKDDKNNPVKTIIGNGLSPDIWKKFKCRFGISKVYEFYGAAESNWIFTNILNLDNTVGLNAQIFSIIEFNIEIEDPYRGDDSFCKKVNTGEIGLLVFKITDKFSFQGYTDKLSTEKKILRNVFEQGDAWFNSGDLVRDIGYKHIQFIDRVGDTFRYKGENVSTVEAEKVLNSYPTFRNSNVYGVQIPNTNGRIGMAAVQTDEKIENINFSDIYSYLESNLPGYAIPVFIRLLPEFSLTSTYKKIKFNFKKEGFNPDVVNDPVFALLPSQHEYTKLTSRIYKDILEGKYIY